MCCRRRYENGAVYSTRRCRKGAIRTLVDVLVKHVEEKRQERALLKQLAPEISQEKSALKECYPPAVLERGLAQEPRQQQGRTFSAPPPQYSDEKGRMYVDEQRRGYEVQAPPPMYEKVMRINGREAR
ncbi:hypothetical protein MMC26_003354 [Xylographa opegraphella]|nr:hypothetical protein [Xylographa opegraphella]